MAELSIANMVPTVPQGVQGGAGIGAGLSTPESARNREAAKGGLANEFRESLAKASGATATPAAAGLTAAANGTLASNLKFSAHAVERMKSRGISFSQELMKGIENAVSRAAQKGSKDTLVLAGDNALIVSVKNNTVVTVMDRAAMRENVFTNIDSTVVV